jgi:hypothetical protein
MLEREIGGTGSHTMENSVWQRQCTCRKADCMMNVDDDDDAHIEREIHTVCSLILLSVCVSVRIGCLSSRMSRYTVV